jgi:hypothetical protein
MSRFKDFVIAGGAVTACALAGIGTQSALAQTPGQCESATGGSRSSSARSSSGCSNR